MMHIYKKLLPELNGATSNTKFDIEGLSSSLFQKYFQGLLRPPSQTESKAQLRCLLEARTNLLENIPPFTVDDLWVFGYGSLVWKADFPYIDRRCGFIKKFKRRFYQHSIDHRGTPDKPGRVVTLIPTEDESDRVYGMAYRIADRHRTDVLSHLDHREKNGYERCELLFYEFPEAAGCSFNLIMYVATKENESWAGDVWQLDRIADQIFTSAGPSGPNREYLFNLANAMRILFPGVQDEHLFELEKAVLRRIECDEATILEKALLQELICILQSAEISIRNAEDDEAVVAQFLKQFEALRGKCDEPGWREAILARHLAKNE